MRRLKHEQDLEELHTQLAIARAEAQDAATKHELETRLHLEADELQSALTASRQVTTLPAHRATNIAEVLKEGHWVSNGINSKGHKQYKRTGDKHHLFSSPPPTRWSCFCSFILSILISQRLLSLCPPTFSLSFSPNLAVCLLEPYGALKHQGIEMASTPSDHRDRANVLADLRRKDWEDDIVKVLPPGKDGRPLAVDDAGWKMRALDQAFKDLKVAEAGGPSCKVCKQELALLRARVRECEGLAFGIGSA